MNYFLQSIEDGRDFPTSGHTTIFEVIFVTFINGEVQMALLIGNYKHEFQYPWALESDFDSCIGFKIPIKL